MLLLPLLLFLLLGLTTIVYNLHFPYAWRCNGDAPIVILFLEPDTIKGGVFFLETTQGTSSALMKKCFAERTSLMTCFSNSL